MDKLTQSTARAELEKQETSFLRTAQILIETFPLLVKDKENNIYLYNEKEHVYEDLVGAKLEEFYLNEFVEAFPLEKLWKKAHKDGVFSYLKATNKIPVVNMNGDDNIIIFNNGVLDLEKNILLEHNPRYYSTHKIKIDYKLGDTNCPRFKGFLHKAFSGDKELIDNAIMLGGYLLTNHSKAEAIFMLDGEGGAGKSMLLNIYQYFISEDQVSSATQKEMLTPEGRAELIGKKVNISPEEKSDYLDAEAMKGIVTGDKVSFRFLFKDKISMRLSIKLVMACNGLPKFKDKTDGTSRRICIFPFKNQFKPEAQITMNDLNSGVVFPIEEDLKGALEKEKLQIFNLFLIGLKELQERNWRFKQPQSVVQALKEYREDIDPVRELLLDNYVVNYDIETTLKDMYDEYKDWYKESISESAAKRMSMRNFSKSVQRVFKIKPTGKRIPYMDGLKPKTTISFNLARIDQQPTDTISLDDLNKSLPQKNEGEKQNSFELGVE